MIIGWHFASETPRRDLPNKNIPEGLHFRRIRLMKISDFSQHRHEYYKVDLNKREYQNKDFYQLSRGQS